MRYITFALAKGRLAKKGNGDAGACRHYMRGDEGRNKP